MPKRILQGVVTSDKNDQTITVSVERRFKHPVLQKLSGNQRNTELMTRKTRLKKATQSE